MGRQEEGKPGANAPAAALSVWCAVRAGALPVVTYTVTHKSGSLQVREIRWPCEEREGRKHVILHGEIHVWRVCSIRLVGQVLGAERHTIHTHARGSSAQGGSPTPQPDRHTSKTGAHASLATGDRALGLAP